MKTVIMAGGKGTRISSVASDIPKPMIKIEDVPVLEREILNLKKQGFTDIILTVSHLGKIIMDYFKDGKEFGVNIKYYNEETPLGNAGALFKIKEDLTEDFLLLNGDAIFDIDFNRFVKYHKEKGGLVTLFTHPNSHPYDSGLIITDENDKVLRWLNKEDERPEYYNNLVNAGLHVISPKLLEKQIDKEKIDLDRDLLKPLAGTGLMYSYKSSEYVKDMGTPDRYASVCDDFRNGRVEAKNLCNKQKAIFLDRDGTINKSVGFLNDIDKLELIDDAAKAIKKINDNGYLAIVITNQPIIARGEATIEELDLIHKKLETILGLEHAYIDGLYYCPHHPDKGFAGERIEYKIKCECRKPAPGLILKAQADFNIDLEKSYMIGDQKMDVLCGKNAGCKTGYIGSNNEFEADIYGDSLYDVVNKIFGE